MDILDIISQSLLHPLDTTAQAQLDHWLAESEEHQQLYQSLLASDDLAEQYHRCMNLMKERLGQNSNLSSKGMP